MIHAFLIKYGEIGIKGKNRYLFEDALIRQIRHALAPLDGTYEVYKTQGRVFVESSGNLSIYPLPFAQTQGQTVAPCQASRHRDFTQRKTSLIFQKAFSIHHFPSIFICLFILLYFSIASCNRLASGAFLLAI